jgi:hypothetical protein
MYVYYSDMLHHASNLRAPIWSAYHVGDEKWNFNENPDKQRLSDIGCDQRTYA